MLGGNCAFASALRQTAPASRAAALYAPMNRDSKRPVTLEDLLSLKRAERPPAEFWTRFERDLRAKQLAALVEKRPWWQSMPRLFAGFSRYHLPIGATAVV